MGSTLGRFLIEFHEVLLGETGLDVKKGVASVIDRLKTEYDLDLEVEPDTIEAGFGSLSGFLSSYLNMTVFGTIANGATSGADCARTLLRLLKVSGLNTDDRQIVAEATDAFLHGFFGEGQEMIEEGSVSLDEEVSTNDVLVAMRVGLLMIDTARAKWLMDKAAEENDPLFPLKVVQMLLDLYGEDMKFQGVSPRDLDVAVSTARQPKLYPGAEKTAAAC